MRAIVAIAGEHEAPLPEPAQQYAAELPEQPRRRPVPASGLVIVLFRVVQRHEEGQGPEPARKREADQHGQHHPLVTPAEDRE